MRETAEQYRRETMRVLRYFVPLRLRARAVSSLAVAIIAVSVGLRLLGGELSLGVGLFVLLLAPEAFLPLRRCAVPRRGRGRRRDRGRLRGARGGSLHCSKRALCC
jgi:ABC-type transport system involved in cytochrome bd biosynthesis fused ATPase/permease subunit